MQPDQAVNVFRKSLLALALALSAADTQAMVINATYTGTLISGEQAAFQYAAQQFENLFSNNVSINIIVSNATKDALGSKVGLGASLTSISTGDGSGYSFNTIKSHINFASGHTELSGTSPVPAGSTIALANAEAKAIGLLTPANDSGYDTDIDGTFYFNSAAFNYDTATNGTVQAGKYDFVAIAEHEISEILGRIPGLNTQKANNGDPYITPYDLYRYVASGTHSFSVSDSGAYFSLNNGVTNLQGFNSGSGDPQDWNGSNPHDAFNATLAPGVVGGITPVDIQALQALGYHAVPLPSSLLLFISACLGLVSVNRRKHPV